jgi:exportin-5
MHNVGKFLKDSPSSLPRTADIPNMLDLHLSIVQNESLHVSIPSLHLFAQILGSEQSADLPALSDLIGPLLEICTQRSIRYEYLPESSGHPALAFLNEDIETVPERHAFLGNYARYGKDIVVSIVKKRPFEALYHILGQADGVLCNPYVGMAPFGPADYKKTSIAALKVDAQCSVVDASLHAYTKWCSDIRAKPEDAATNKQVQSMNENLERWGIQLMQLTYQDPSIQQRVIQLIVEIAIGPLKRNEDFMIRAFQHVINIKLRTKNVANDTEPVLYQDVLKELQRYCTQQLQRIAMRASDYLIDRYDDLAAAISQCFVGDGSDEEDKEKCSSVLFVIIQRATTLDDGDRARRLQSFVEPFMSKWSSPQLAESLQAFPGFCDLLGLNGFQEYFLNRKAHSIRDWADVQLDEEGLALKARIEGARAALPLRSTKTYFSASLDRSEPGSRHYDAACALWANYLTIMLPNLLQMVGLAHIFSEPASWMHLPEETRTIPKRILKDRFWQVGISEGTREDFYNKVESTKTTLEGLASTIRGCLRFVRETSYRLITTMSLLGDPFYRFQELPGPLSRAVFENSGALSTHQTNTLIDMMKPIIEHCPSDAREHFLAPMLSEMFNSLDNKVRMEWAVIDQHNKAASASGDLVEEMKEESILRSMTYSCVTVVARLFDPNDGKYKHHPTPCDTV